MTMLTISPGAIWFSGSKGSVSTLSFLRSPFLSLASDMILPFPSSLWCVWYTIWSSSPSSISLRLIRIWQQMSAQCPDLEGLRFQRYAYNATTAVPEVLSMNCSLQIPFHSPRKWCKTCSPLRTWSSTCWGSFPHWTQMVRTVPRIIEVACRKQIRDNLPERCQMEKPIALSFCSGYCGVGHLASLLAGCQSRWQSPDKPAVRRTVHRKNDALRNWLCTLFLHRNRQWTWPRPTCTCICIYMHSLFYELAWRLTYDYMV